MRREGLVPAVVYGKTQENLNVKVNAREFSALLNSSVSEHILVDLEIEGKKLLAMLQDVQHDPMTGALVHADFHAVSANETLHALVPVEVEGEAPGTKMGGLLEMMVHELSVVCLPDQLPDTVVVDVSDLQLGQAVHVSDLKLPEGVQVEMDPTLVVVVVSEPRVAVESEEGAGPAEPEVLREKKPAEGKQG